MKRALAIPAVLVALAGCGEKDEPTEKEGQPAPAAEAPKPKASLKATLPAFEKAVRGGKCREMAKYMLHSSPRGNDAQPDDPPKPEECKFLATLRDQVLPGFKTKDVAEFGPAAVVDGTGEGTKEGEVVSTSWAIDRDGSWKLLLGGFFDPQVGSKPKPETDFDGNAEAFVEAVRKKDCKEIWRLIDGQARFVTARDGNRAKFCEDVATAYKEPDGAFPEIVKSPDAKLEPLGKTLDMAFYGLELKSGRYLVVYLTTAATDAGEAAKGHANPGLFDYLTVRNPSE